MRKKWTNKGFTLAEILIVIAIIGILGGVAAVNVSSHFRSMTKMEYDNYAKSIFIAAQNHLTMAKHEGYLGRSIFGEKENKIDSISDTGKEGTFYYVVEDGSGLNDANSVLGLILPSNSIDGTVRSNSYIIRYDRGSAQVLDVFYWSTGHGGDMFNRSRRFAHYYNNDYADFLKKRDNKDALKTYDKDKSVIGYYGGVEAQSHSVTKILDPSIELINEEILHVRITDPNKSTESATWELIIEGNTSKAVARITIDDSDRVTEQSGEAAEEVVYDVVLDDITTARHFANLTPDSGTFLPGEDITVYAVAYSTELSNVGYSAKLTTNSLYGDNSTVTAENDIQSTIKKASVSAAINNFRHLENISHVISSIGVVPATTDDTVYLTKAEQWEDIVWDGFLSRIRELNGVTDVQIIPCVTGVAASKKNTYFPVDPEHDIEYYGQRHKITGVKIDISGNAGLFGELKSGTEVKDLELIDFQIKGGNVGALAGTANAEITNVLAHNSTGTIKEDITATGNAGGLIGSLTGGTVSKCAAALTVKGDTAGGLIGSMSGGDVKASYAGGHTEKASYYSGGTASFDTYGKPNNGIYNVTGATAGGLIGSMSGDTSAICCYSTCSVKGSTMAGGFVGNAGGDIRYSYCTGLVSGATEGAFAGTISSSAIGCQYFGIINERMGDKDGVQTFTYLPAVGSGTGNEIDSLDTDTGSYNDFFTNTAYAHPYDSTLTTYYGGKYNLKPIIDIVVGDDPIVEETDFVKYHYGDWPAPEIFTFNIVA